MLALAMTLGVALGLVVAQPTAAHAGETDTIYSLVNEARWSQGSTGLVRNSAMDAVAANWAASLAQTGTLSHNPEYSSQIPGGWVGAGENVAQGYSGGSAMHEGWMNSPGHRANILGNFTDIGIAYLEAGGTTWGVQVFANYPGSVGPAAPVAASAPAAPVVPAPVAEEPAPVEAAPAPALSLAPTPVPTTSASPVDRVGKDASADMNLTAGELENRKPPGSAESTAASFGGTSPLSTAVPGAAIAGALLVAAAGVRSYRVRAKRPGRSRHAA
jgi:Cysteine-rich secretory protein family